MRAVIISGGKITNYEYIKTHIQNGDTIICADSGYNHAVKMGIKPDIVVGDFDSIGKIPTDVECLRYPPRKDLTDTEIALEHAREKGFTEFIILGATGGRIDHSLTNILLLKSTLPRNEKAILIDEHNKIFITDSRLKLHEPCGSIVSLIPLTHCTGVTTKNLEYPLHNAEMFVGKGLGVSNITTADSAEVSVTEGVLLVIVARD
ncbi:MAG: thiamine diphosphokinase [Defluviitaleaceae bacterium]|nr:thiamine diphosphokinase [Defluviitaleaceae bacterium]MCL2263617.1 thiamine diphosphokinase [Defluviitaleaceae bacterium]